jgi:arginase family enzyme
MEHGVTVLNFDETYVFQKHLQRPFCEWIDLSDIPSTKRFCEMDSLSKIKKRVQKRKNRGITFLGSGNFHYVSLLFIAEIKEPFTLILFDHHTDMMESPSQSVISCGSWVLHAMDRLPMLQKVIIIGASPEFENQIPPHMRDKVSLLQNKDSESPEPLTRWIVSHVPTKTVYISIDKDVLDQTEAITDWDQGNMKIHELVRLVKCIMTHYNVAGVDICGEYPLSPLGMFSAVGGQTVRKNEKANRMILDTIMGLYKATG